MWRRGKRSSRSETHGDGETLLDAARQVVSLFRIAKREVSEDRSPSTVVMNDGVRRLVDAASRLAGANREDPAAVGELLDLGCASHELVQATRWFQLDGRAEERTVANRAFRLLMASRDHDHLRGVEEADVDFMAALDALADAGPGDAWETLVDLVPGLPDLQAKATAATVSRSAWTVLEPHPATTVGWFSLSADADTHGREGRSTRPGWVNGEEWSAVTDLVETLKGLVGPNSDAPSAVLRSHVALEVCLAYLAGLQPVDVRVEATLAKTTVLVDSRVPLSQAARDLRNAAGDNDDVLAEAEDRYSMRRPNDADGLKLFSEASELPQRAARAERTIAALSDDEQRLLQLGPADAFLELVGRSPELASIERDARHLTASPPRSRASIAEKAYRRHVGNNLGEETLRKYRYQRDLLDQLKPFLGPDADTEDPLLRTQVASHVALCHLTTVAGLPLQNR